MKKKLFAALCVLTITFNFNFVSAQTQTENDPISLLKTGVYHAIILGADKDMRNFLVTLKDKSFQAAFSSEVISDGKNNGLIITARDRGDKIEFSYNLDSLKVKVFVNLNFEESIRATDVQYFSQSGKLYSGEWFDVSFSKQTKFSKTDDMKSFIFHSKVVAQMMRGGLRPLDVLFTRLVYNMMYEKSYFDVFKDIVIQQGLKIEGRGGDVYIAGGGQSYQIMENGVLQPVMQVFPGW